MGVDIHMKLIDKYGTVLIDSLYDGRNSEWFDNLMNRGYDEEYDELPRMIGIPEVADDETAKAYSKENHGFYYGFSYIKTTDFIDWFNKYRPDISAGWVKTYDKWAYEHKGIIPNDVSRYLSEDNIIEDMHFIEIVNPYDPNRSVLDRLYEYDKNWQIDLKDTIIVYYFDC